ncbi:hypothetical protein [Streptosporangium sp. LJ11]|uniref:hypothetical protein n=1 Tax=Streptosporangium sp. LJ11 TaxID=3436927 RepID=UPI003F79DEA4
MAVVAEMRARREQTIVSPAHLFLGGGELGEQPLVGAGRAAHVHEQVHDSSAAN